MSTTPSRTGASTAQAPLFQRSAEPLLRAALRQYPVVVLTGARQTGKSTLIRQVLPHWTRVSLEDPDTREFARLDPRGFLRQHGTPLAIDEAQHVPELFSYIQGLVDESGRMGQYLLTGSQQFSLLAGITQSLAGRAALIELHPMRLKELADAGHAPGSLDAALLYGGYPAVHARRLDPHGFYADYVQSYLERDVRSLTAVQDLGNFQRFLRMAAARAGQLLNLNGLANDCGISQPTAGAWMNVLEASYVVRRVAPYHRNFGKRLVKTPKLYFLDTGLCAWLLGIRDAAALQNHYARGALFENWVVTEALKWRAAKGERQPLYFWRDNIGHEVDLVLEQDGGLTLVEIKSGQTFQSDWLRGLRAVQGHVGGAARSALVFGGEARQQRSDALVLGWRDLVEAG